MPWTEQKIIGLRKFLCWTKTKDRVRCMWPNSRSGPLFGLNQNLLSTLAKSIALLLTTFFGSTYICEQAYSHIKVINSGYRWRLVDKLVPK